MYDISMDLTSLRTLIEYPLSDDDLSLITRAYTFSEQKHSGQKRNSGEPYFTHALEVAKNCARLGMDVETIVGALLHDTLEDTDATEDEIKDQFGDQVLFLVKGVTKLGKLKYQGRDRHVESLRKFFVAISEDLRVLIIKLADRLHNVMTLEHVREDKRKRIALETIEVHAALAGRLGMGRLKGLLEDYAFPFAYPKEYIQTKQFLDERAPQAQKTVEVVHAEIVKTLTEYGIKDIKVQSRVKHTYSLYRKLVKYSMNEEKVFDTVALRVQTQTVTDCYQVLGLVHMLWKPIPGRIKDYIALPKPNGYQSLHTTVITEDGIVEIQIRTFEMHQAAEMGVASHFLYKEVGSKKHTAPKRKLNWLDDLKELHTFVRNPGGFLEQLRVDFFKNRIFVFTPSGDVIDLPEGASPIDFGYAVHSEIGNKISSVHINGKMASLGKVLKNGDIVEILTSKAGHPSSKWLDYAKTSMARKRIRAYIGEHGGILDKFLIKKIVRGRTS
jgi:GTP diphosphokinase / guanosine-3',5'-bis(diphosphate) 3'-diphosphatase